MIRYTKVLSRVTGRTTLTLLLGARPHVLTNSHPNFDMIEAEVTKGSAADEKRVHDLIEVGPHMVRSLREVGRKVGFKAGQVTYRGKPVDPILSAHLVEMLRERNDDYVGFVRALENIAHNPSDVSRQHLFTWMRNGNLTFNRAGEIVAYKGVVGGGQNLSVYSGVAYVDGVRHQGQIPNPVGAVISMPREEVDSDRGRHCSHGLHVGTHTFAAGFMPAEGKLLAVAVDPRDWVSVPNDKACQKGRVCRYRVLAEIPGPIRSTSWERSPYAAGVSVEVAVQSTDMEDGGTVDSCAACGSGYCNGTCEPMFDTGYDDDSPWTDDTDDDDTDAPSMTLSDDLASDGTPGASRGDDSDIEDLEDV